ncbi:MAG: TonB C-terminal domain-containing protein [Alphaproteobacteria bacterium]|nr:TonB C-terminal domain-containing protein [Alphaproteobacteria bacterium]
MPRSFFKSVFLHIIILGVFALPLFKAVKKEIVPSHPIPIVFDKIVKEKVPVKKAVKKPAKKKKSVVAKKKPSVKPKAKKLETKKNAIKIPEKPKPIKEIKKQKDFSSLLSEIDEPKSEPISKTFDSVLKDLTPEGFKPKIAVEEVEEDIPDSLIEKLKNNFTVAEEDALRSQIMNNWLVPVGAKDIEEMAVDIKITVEKGGDVSSIKVINNKLSRRKDRAYEIFVTSAKRAVLKSSPLKLSEERLKIKSEIVFHFAPTDMF